MNILIIGVGSIGKRHMRNLLSIGKRNIIVIDKEINRLNDIKESYPEVETIHSKDEIPFQNYDVVFICTPPDSHLALLDKALEADCHCFVEKPFALSAEGIKPLLKKAEEKGLKIMTGFNMRYLPLILELKKKLKQGIAGKILSCQISLSSYMPGWHPEEDYRKSFMAFNATGGGALFDYVHGLDLAQWLIDPIEEIFCKKHTSSLEMETDDMAALIATTKHNVIIMFYFDFVDRVHRKSINIIGTQGTIIWEFSTQESLRFFSTDTNTWTEILRKADYDTPYISEIEDFLGAIKNNKSVESNGYNGLSTMKLLDSAQESSISNKAVKI